MYFGFYIYLFFCFSKSLPISLSEFLESVLAIYEDLLVGKNPNTVIVPTSASSETISSEETETQEGVDSSVLLECIEGLCERFKHK